MKNSKILNEVQVQQSYYAETARQYTARQYNDMHVHEGDEHYLALAFPLSVIDHFKFRSILDVGAGTGRAMLFLKEKGLNS
jgi:2-polyprenyl-3-methyl-5-hydroxy-6-metoxy-1,4-benzoquinol methylase